MRLLRKLPMLLKRSLARKTLCMEENNKAHQVFKVSLGGLLFYLAGFLPYNIFFDAFASRLDKGKAQGKLCVNCETLLSQLEKGQKRVQECVSSCAKR